LPSKFQEMQNSVSGCDMTGDCTTISKNNLVGRSVCLVLSSRKLVVS